MVPIYSYLCGDCGHEFDEIGVYDPEANQFAECRCGSPAGKLPSLPGGYHMTGSGSSTRPKRAGSKGSGKKLNFNNKVKE